VASAIAGAIGVPELMGGHHWLSHQLSSIVGASHEAHLSVQTEWILMAISVTIAIIALLIAISIYRKKADDEAQTALGKFLFNKWYIDELYDNVIVNPLHKLAGFLKEVVEKNVIDGFVNGTGKFVQYSARKVRLIQSGQVGYYILWMVLGIVILFLLWFNDLSVLAFLFKLTPKS
jgi:NADH-quinone oxidoreductase subunit L